jgi:hypothetical protein
MDNSAEKVCLTQHLDSRYGSHSGEIMLCNLAYGTRILADSESWEKLTGYMVPQPLSQDSWLERARDAHLLVGDVADEPPDSVVRLLTSLKTYLKTDTGSPLELLDQAEAHFRQHHMPIPYSGPAQGAGPMMQKPSRLVDFLFDHTRAFLTYDLNPVKGLDLDLVRLFCERPAMKLRYEQQFCTPHTTQLRARKIAASIPAGGRVLVLGDDDLVSLALVHYGGDFQVDVLELDTDLVAFLKAKGGERLTVLEHNLRHGVPESMRRAYDVVTTDPPYAANGMRFFLQCAADSLNEKPSSRLFLSTFPGLIESPDRLWSDLKELGLQVEQRWDHFSRYIYNNTYRVEHLAALRQLGSPLHPTSELLGFPFLYAHFFECSKA